jgi:hypothetical protein
MDASGSWARNQSRETKLTADIRGWSRIAKSGAAAHALENVQIVGGCDRSGVACRFEFPD